MSTDYDIRISRELEDALWDKFVEFDADGEFEQTSRWAQVKREAGWEPLRITFLNNQKIVAGSQILLRRMPLIGYVGYISKGPVIAFGEADLTLPLITSLKEIIKKRNIQYLILQPSGREVNPVRNSSGALNPALRGGTPYGAEPGIILKPNPAAEQRGIISNGVKENILVHSGFQCDKTLRVIRASTMIDLSADTDHIFKKMARKNRQHIRLGERSGVKIREGGKEDINLFFKLMSETCKRQGVAPNPSSESFFHGFWDLFSPKGQAKLFFAEYKGEIVSGLFTIPFGKVVTAWKFGWSGKYEEVRPNHLLHWEAIKWAKNEGYRYFDFMGIERNAAESVMQGKHFYDAARGPCRFKLSFGGDVILLPEAYFYIRNPFLRLMYKEIYPTIRKMRIIRSWIERF